MMSPSERAEILSSIRDSASKLSHKSRNEDGSYDLSSDHHLKVRLYENLLSSVFDILEEGQILVVSFLLKFWILAFSFGVVCKVLNLKLKSCSTSIGGK